MGLIINMALNSRKTAPETIEAREKAAKALLLRKEGLTFEQIAEELGYNSKQAAYDSVKRALDRITREPAEDVLKLDLERLDAIWTVSYLNAQSGDPVAINSCLKIMERRAKLLGLDTVSQQPEQQPQIGKIEIEVVGANIKASDDEGAS